VTAPRPAPDPSSASQVTVNVGRCVRHK
jgi:hypothetical protein